MPLVCFFFHVLLLIFLFALNVQGQISFSLGNVTYWSVGSHVKLSLKSNMSLTGIPLIQWQFTRTEGSAPLSVAILSLGKLTFLNPLFNVTDQATLEFKNANLTYNGTYSLLVTLGGGGNIMSNVLVIILIQPVANITCNSSVALDEGDNFTCNCSGTAGNPPPSASWHKNNEIIETVGYRIKMLNITNVNKTDKGTYVCRAQSHNLSDERPVEVNVFYKPTDVMLTSNVANNIVQLGGSVELTCFADSNPNPNYQFFFNGTKVANNTDGVFSFANASYRNNGTYTCRASNRLGSAEMNLSLVVEELPSARPTTAETSPAVSTETPTETTSTTAPTGGNENQSGTKTGLIVGIVVGVLVIIILIVAIWWYFFRGSRRSKEREHVVPRTESGASQSAGFVPTGENPYESADGYKENESAEDGGAGSSVNNAPADGPRSSMPPVYAVVDKSKKKPKKEDALTYASLDPVALQPDSSKMRVRDHKGTDYAAIDLDKLKKNDV